MILIRRSPDNKPKRPTAPKMTAHFSANWHERTDRSLTWLWRWWRSAQFLGETEDVGRYRAVVRRRPLHRHQTRRVQYYALTPEWVVLVTNPVSGHTRFLSVWPRRWFDRLWRVAQRQTAAHTQAEAARTAREAARRERQAQA